MWRSASRSFSSARGKLLKLFVAAPDARWHLLAAQILARLVFLALEATILVAFAVVALDVPLRGSLVAFGAVAAFGAMTFVGIGLLVASRPRTIEGVSG